MQRHPMLLLFVAAGLVVVVVLACTAVSPQTPSGGATANEQCQGVSAELGGCDEDQPRFSATTCAGVGAEFGAEINRRALEVINGPEIEGGDSRSVRMGEVMFLVTSRVNQHLRENGMVEDCDVPEFMRAAEAQFSEELKARAGEHLYGGTTRPYSEWLWELERTVRVIDMGEDEPLLPSASPSA